MIGDRDISVRGIMKNLQITVLLLVSLYGSICSAADRGILFLQQERPGHIIYVSLNELTDNAMVNVIGMGASKVNKETFIPIRKFNEMWKLVHSEQFNKFSVPDDSKRNMADPRFYTISYSVKGNTKKIIQIPITEKKGKIGVFVNKLKDFIPGKS